jgi:acetoacetyl-CoA reductase/3-oxoacyl-[acyl-carrier protein] reductase
MSTKIVFVTGASRGIGKAIAIKMLEKGYIVGIGYNQKKEYAEAIVEKYEHAIAIQVNIADRNSIRKAISEFENKVGGSIEILVNNAAVVQEKPFETITDEDWQNMLNINLAGAFKFTQEVLPGMVKKEWGRIINIVSIGGQWGGFNQVHYAAAKAGLISFTMSMAKIYSKFGITTNAISPGLVSTDMTQRELQSEAGKKKVENIPIGRVGFPEEIAATVAFLSSEDASYVTGQTINVNGGMYFG